MSDRSAFYKPTTLNCSGQLLDLSEPVVMGIVNVTPDSFYDGGRLKSDRDLLHQVENMVRDGAALLDIGGMSSRPGSKPVDELEEMNRVLPAIRLIRSHVPDAILSIDTWRASVAEAAVQEGAGMINDISAGELEEGFLEKIARLRVPYILMHMQGQPGNMQQKPHYDHVVLEILDFFIHKTGILRKLGITDIVLDPGFGFGKTLDHNYELLANLHDFQQLNLPILAGISRKSMICRALNVPPAEALNGTTALHMAALQEGASILRVHDVKEARQTITLWQWLNKHK